MTRIAIIGASGQISRGLATVFSKQDDYQLYLFSRSPSTPTLREFYSRFLRSGVDSLLPLDEFEKHEYDVVINSAGEGDQAEQTKLGITLFQMSEHLDNRILKYLEKNTQVLYFFLSSGAVYGRNYAWPVSLDSLTSFSVNRPLINSVYTLAKIVAETRHYHLSSHTIYDIRIFGYFSQYIRLDSSFFLSELANSIVSRVAFNTTRLNMVRDYIDQFELSSLISSIIQTRPPSNRYDIYSREPITKLSLLEFCKKTYGLNVNFIGEETLPDPEENSMLNPEMHPSILDSANVLGHMPLRSSLEIISDGIDKLICYARISQI